MELEHLANTAEVIALVLVVASLIYVARQLRQNTRMMRAASRNSIQHGHQKEILMIVEYPDIWRAFTGEALADDGIRVNQWLTASVRAREHEWSRFQHGALDVLAWETFSKAIPLVLAKEPARAWWETARPIFDTGFADKVDELLEDKVMNAVHENQAAAGNKKASRS